MIDYQCFINGTKRPPRTCTKFFTPRGAISTRRFNWCQTLVKSEPRFLRKAHSPIYCCQCYRGLAWRLRKSCLHNAQTPSIACLCATRRDEFLTVADSFMDKSQLLKLVVGQPHIWQDNWSWCNHCRDNWQKRVVITLVNHFQHYSPRQTSTIPKTQTWVRRARPRLA